MVNDGSTQQDNEGLSSLRREVILLAMLAQVDRLFTKNELISAVRAAGFTEVTEAAIVTQLHRLTVLKVIERPFRGAYLITDAGRKRLAQQRARLGDKAPR